ncbi:hypothetical protein ACXM0N_04725 [Peribacillus simplex]
MSILSKEVEMQNQCSIVCLKLRAKRIVVVKKWELNTFVQSDIETLKALRDTAPLNDRAKDNCIKKKKD